ncbi:MAG: UTP--glucose-1-phosphate uridylyltransferase [Tetrasphaera sp.]|nr:UTP--glucose-1-phosphate uridylyltransferase [Tetrasphaera sp.]
MSSEGLQAATATMARAGVSTAAIGVFERFYGQLEANVTGYVPEDTIDPLGAVTRLVDIAQEGEPDREALRRTVVLKLNGGLGTSMGITGPKSALPVRDGLTFLDIMARQVLALRERYEVGIPLLLMNSFRTREESLEILARYPDLVVDGLPLDFLQSQEPKLRADDLSPVNWPADPELEWCPPGHGDVYVSLLASGILEALRDRGYRYLFLSNADNLGATCDPDIPAWMAAQSIPYVAEVCERTHNDRKGGHLAVRKRDQRVVLRDSAMVVPGEDESFQDTTRHQLFHANNLWVDLDVLARELAEHDGVLPLPMIVNRKTVDPTDPSSTPVIQIESAMGAAIEIFEGSRALEVPRTRFRPVKSTNELLLIRSDLYRLDEDWMVQSTIDHPEPFIDLGRSYTMVDDFEERFPAGVPLIRECSSLRVKGDVTFGAQVRCVGDVVVTADGPRQIADGTVLRGSP